MKPQPQSICHTCKQKLKVIYFWKGKTYCEKHNDMVR